jgi:hypothetical protein
MAKQHVRHVGNRSARPGYIFHVPLLDRRVLQPFGAELVVTADDPRVFEACSEAVARFPTDAGAVGFYSLDISTTTDSAADPAWPVTSIEQHAGGIVLRCGSAEMRVDHNARTATATLPPSLLACSDAVRVFVEGALSSLLIGAGQLHAVHSGLVVSGNCGLVLRGPSGAGKSTLTYACLASGFSVSSDDWIYGVASATPDRLYGYPWRMFLVPDAPRHFPELADLVRVPHPGSDQFKLPIAPPEAKQSVSATVTAIVFLDPSPELDIRAVSASEAFERFWEPALPTERANLPGEWVDALLDRPCFVLQRGTDPAKAADLLQRLATNLS